MNQILKMKNCNGDGASSADSFTGHSEETTGEFEGSSIETSQIEIQREKKNFLKQHLITTGQDEKG